jgi:hypothetical protein
MMVLCSSVVSDRTEGFVNVRDYLLYQASQERQGRNPPPSVEGRSNTATKRHWRHPGLAGTTSVDFSEPGYPLGVSFAVALAHERLPMQEVLT